MTTYTDVFGNDTIPPAGQAYAAVSLTADTQFYWPEMPGSAYIAASILEVTADGNHQLRMPPANQVSNGRDCVIVNKGANTFTITDSAASTIFTLEAGISAYLYITDNSTAAGTWGTFTYGAGTASSASTSLAGAGLTSLGGLIVANDLVVFSTTDYSVLVGDRAHLIVFTAGSAAADLPTVASLTNGYFVGFRNSGTGTTTITPAGGVLIDGASTKTLSPTESLICYTDGSNWYTVGHGRSTTFQFTSFLKDLTGIAAYTMTTADAANKLLIFSGAPSANTTITIPAITAVYYIQILTSNAYTVAFKTSTGTTVTLNQNDYAIILCDGVDTALAQTADTPPNMALATGTLAAANGGTGQNSSGWAGVPVVAAGTWSVETALPATRGGTGVANNVANTVTFSGNYGLTLTLSNTTSVTLPTTGTLATLGVAQSWTAAQTYDNSMLKLKGSSTGVTTFTSANAGASNYTLTLPAATDTVAALGTAQSWTAAQTFDNSTVKIKGSSTGVTTITSANAGASNYTLTVPAVTDTVALLGTAQTFSAAQNFTSDIKLTGSSGTSGQVLTSAGSGAAPTWTTPATGSDSITITTRTSDTILGAGDVGTLILYTSGTFTQTFTAAATLGSGWFVYIRNAGTGIITLNPNASETIDGLTTALVYPGESFMVLCNGTNFYTVGRGKSVTYSVSYSSVTSWTISQPFTDTEVYSFDVEFSNVIPSGSGLTLIRDGADDGWYGGRIDFSTTHSGLSWSSSPATDIGKSSSNQSSLKMNVSGFRDTSYLKVFGNIATLGGGYSGSFGAVVSDASVSSIGITNSAAATGRYVVTLYRH